MSGKLPARGRTPTKLGQASAQALSAYCPDLENWAKSWCCEERDLVRGQRLVKLFKPFLLHLLTQGLTTKTLRKHRDHLWMLGGEVIRRRHENSTLGRLAVENSLYVLLSEEEGPLIWPRISRPEQEAFDATSRKLYRFLADELAKRKRAAQSAEQ